MICYFMILRSVTDLRCVTCYKLDPGGLGMYRVLLIAVSACGHASVDGFLLCFYKNTDHVFNYMLLMQTTTSGMTQSTGKSKHNKHKSSSSITYQESTTTTPRKAQLHIGACA